MIVLTVDQRGSTQGSDRVPHALALVGRAVVDRTGQVLAFDRTVGDELQGVLAPTPDGAGLAVSLTLALLRDGGWSVGIGVGAVVEPLPPTSREASGEAFVHARSAVARAKAQPGTWGVAVEADDEAAAQEVQALLRLLGVVAARRTEPGWEAVDAVTRAGSQKGAAARLGVSVQAVSQRLRSAAWAEESAVHPVITRLLASLAAGVGGAR
ncbi:hypothetical protein Xcel_1703 [Xylanimonas cellulosilytica DSM 15894]|uniref:DNA-binding protein n=1 Tax=Xylanimonas cellulosilytica (strain DSM 15894 / JCM 12276 / CECT 5975 / KCTC 9989 / LMG 20990 / NBRC 107835 / XIL07) TaxID=446471 RepID=D1BSN4_XYLCX|nr:SatD family protein [Xylanimonas cellulosilytica]ACZ30726.1 hypothetical protein Xcel_1703 [Xylanimonas cellulosilytica DSM 15894]